jgi:hypothetical protein
MPSLLVINWIIGIAGSVGILGVILLAIFAPPAGAALARATGDILKTRLGFAAAIGAGCLYGGLVYGDMTGRGEVKADWDAANERATAAKDAADAENQKALDAKYQPIIAALQKQADARKREADGNESKAIGMAAGAAGACELGAAALRLRKPAK